MIEEAGRFASAGGRRRYTHRMVTRRAVSKKPKSRPPKGRAPKGRAKALNPNQALLRDLLEIAHSIPKELRENLPRDLAAEFDHYHDGTPRQG